MRLSPGLGHSRYSENALHAVVLREQEATHVSAHQVPRLQTSDLQALSQRVGWEP